MTDRDTFTISRADISELAALTPLQIRAWTSVVLGEDGRMYVAVTAHEDWSNQRGRVLAADEGPIGAFHQRISPIKLDDRALQAAP